MHHIQGSGADVCLNCGHVLAESYCPACGQRRVHTDLTLHEFLDETTHELVHWDGKIPRTLKTLFLKPGLLTVDFLAGRRARWLAPLRIYLICSVAYFLSGPLIEAVTHRSAREMARFSITNGDGTRTLTPEMRERIKQGLPARVFGIERLERAAADSAKLNHEIQAVLPKAMFALLPMFALLTWIAWRHALPRYPAHLYVALHLHAAWFGAMMASTIAAGFIRSNTVAGIVGLFVLLYVPWYGLMAVRRIFGESWPRTIAKAGLVTAVYGACFLVTSMSLLAYALWRM